MDKVKSKGGRPRVDRVGLSLRVQPTTKQALDAAAERSGRSLSQEAEAWLEGYLQRQDLLAEVMANAYGRELAGLLQTLGRIMSLTGLHGGMISGTYAARTGDWINDPVAFNGAAHAAQRLLARLRLPVPPADASKAKTAGLLGEQCERNIALLLKHPELGESGGEWSAPTRDLLGRLLDRLPDPDPDEEGT